MISIGGIVLSDHLLMPGIKNQVTRAGSTRYTMGAAGGRAVYISVPILNGQVLELVDPSEMGAFTGTQVDAINEFRATADEVTFVHHLGSWQVVVVGVEVTQADGYANPSANDLYTGTISLMIVSKN